MDLDRPAASAPGYRPRIPYRHSCAVDVRPQCHRRALLVVRAGHAIWPRRLRGRIGLHAVLIGAGAGQAAIMDDERGVRPTDLRSGSETRVSSISGGRGLAHRRTLNLGREGILILPTSPRRRTCAPLPPPSRRDRSASRPSAAQKELGLDLEGGSWQGLHRHALMTMIAFAFLQIVALQKRGGEKRINGPPPQSSLPRRAPHHPRPFVRPPSVLPTIRRQKTAA